MTDSKEGIVMPDQTDRNTTDFPKTSQPALRALLAAGYTHLEQLTTVGEADLLKLHGMGPKAIRILRSALEARGLAFAKPHKKDTAAKQE
jgi:hypothetical protein